MSVLNFRPNLEEEDSKYLIKSVFDINIEIDVFKMSNLQNINKFWAFLILELV